jgi:hypothetical protein
LACIFLIMGNIAKITIFSASTLPGLHFHIFEPSKRRKIEFTFKLKLSFCFDILFRHFVSYFEFWLVSSLLCGIKPR